ncbi:hypothetical protein VTO42DRAFT_2242 [Malbranchea cinnamomea]
MSPNTTAFPSTRLHTLKTHSGPVNTVIFSSSPGTYLLTGSSDRDIHLSRAIPVSSSGASFHGAPPTTTIPIQKYQAHGYSVLDLAVTTDNARFVSVGGDRQVFLWDVETGTTVRRWTGHGGRIETVEFGGEADSVVVSGGSDTTVKIWDTRSLTPKPMQSLDEATDTVSSVHVHNGTSTIISGSYDGRIRSYDIRMGMLRVDVMGHPVTSVRCSEDGNVILASCLDGRIRLVDREDGSVLKAFGGDTATTSSEKGTAPKYKNEALRIRSSFGKGDSVVFSGGETDKDDLEAAVFAWDVVSGEVIRTVRAGAGVKVVSCVAWNEKGGCWAGGCSDGTVQVFG